LKVQRRGDGAEGLLLDRIAVIANEGDATSSTSLTPMLWTMLASPG
jgi:hypothetical protein